MNPEKPMTPREETEMRLTALLMGELSPEEAAALRAQMAKDPRLAVLHARLQKAVELLREASAIPEQPAPPAPVQLSSERRERLLAHFKSIAPAPTPTPIVELPRRDWSWLISMGLAAALIAVLGGSLLMNDTLELHKSYSEPPNFAAHDEWKAQPGMVRGYASPPAPISPSAPAAATAAAEIPAPPTVALIKSGAGTLTIGGTNVKLPALAASSASQAITANGSLATAAQPANPIVGNLQFYNDWDGADRRATRGNSPAPVLGDIPLQGTLFGNSRDPQSQSAASNLATDAKPGFQEDQKQPFSSYDVNGVVLSGSNTFTGGTTINGGTVTIASGSGAVAGTGGLVVNAGKSVEELTVNAGSFAMKAPTTPAPMATAAGGTLAMTPQTTSFGKIEGLAKNSTETAGYIGNERGANAGGGSDVLRRSDSLTSSAPQSALAMPSATPAERSSSDSSGGFALGGEIAAARGSVRIDYGHPIPAQDGRPTATLAPTKLAQNTIPPQNQDHWAFSDGTKIQDESRFLRKAGNGQIELPLGLTSANDREGEKAKIETKSGAVFRMEVKKPTEKEAEVDGPAVRPMPAAEAPRIAGNTRTEDKVIRREMEISQKAQVAVDGGALTPKSDRLFDAVGELAVASQKNASEGKDLDAQTRSEAAKKMAALDSPVPAPAAKGVEVARLEQLEKQLNNATREMKRKEQPEAEALAKEKAPAPVPQPEIATSANAFSTFSLNVSDVAFKLAAASLEQGRMPELATVRSEEFINAFDYRDPEPAAGAPLAFASERARYPFAQNRDLLRLSIKTAAAGRQSGRALNLVLLLDNSGSMERADRVRILKEALRVLCTQLQPQDKLSVVTFARTPRLWADGVAGDKAAEATARVSEITPQGGTNLAAALDLGYKTALKHYQVGSINRVVLLTDGAANLGDVNPDALKQKVETNRKQGIALDCFGIGWEGLDDTLLEALSRNGDGRYGFLNSPEEAATEFAGQLAGALRVAASDVKVQVEFNPRRVTAYRQIGYAKHQLTKEQFRDNTVDAAEIGAAESGNALYVVEVNPRGEGDLATVRVRFKVPGTSDYKEHEWTVPFTPNIPPLEQASPALRLAGSASAFAEWLVASPYAAEVTTDRLLSLLNGVPAIYGADPRPQKLEWMIRQAKSVSGR
jgi:autotransporter-associated beta strand protein